MATQEEITAIVIDDMRRAGIEARKLEQCEHSHDFIALLLSISQDMQVLADKYFMLSEGLEPAPDMKEETVLNVPVVRVISPCEECGKPGVNLKYSLVGIVGVLCQECLEATIKQVNYALTETSKQDSQEQEP